MGHCCPMAPSVFRGPGRPLGWAGWAQTGSGAPGPKWKVRGTRSSPTSGPSRDELKSKEDPFGGTGLAGAPPVWWGWRVLPGCVTGEGRRRASASFPEQKGSLGLGPHGRAYPDSLPQSQATRRPCPDLEVHWGSEARGQHAGQGWNVSSLWLAGDSGPPGSGAHEGMYGGYHTSTDLRLLGGAPRACCTGYSAPCRGKAVFSFCKQLGCEVGAGYSRTEGVRGGGAERTAPGQGQGTEAN